MTHLTLIPLLSQVYAVYGEHSETVRQYASLLWSDLDVGKMMAGTEVGAWGGWVDV